MTQRRSQKSGLEFFSSLLRGERNFFSFGAPNRCRRLRRKYSVFFLCLLLPGSSLFMRSISELTCARQRILTSAVARFRVRRPSSRKPWRLCLVVALCSSLISKIEPFNGCHLICFHLKAHKRGGKSQAIPFRLLVLVSLLLFRFFSGKVDSPERRNKGPISSITVRITRDARSDW